MKLRIGACCVRCMSPTCHPSKFPSVPSTATDGYWRHAGILVRCIPLYPRHIAWWLDNTYLAARVADTESEEAWGELVDLLTYLDKKVCLAVTTCTGSRRLAFKTFVTSNSTGKPLTQMDLLKALLVQNQAREDPMMQTRTGPLRQWADINSALESLSKHLSGRAGQASMYNSVVASEGAVNTT